MALNKGGDFEPHPDTDGDLIRAVIIDVTEPKEVKGKFGDKTMFKIVFQTEYEDDQGKKRLMWSRGYTETLAPRSNLRKDLGKLRGSPITDEEVDAMCEFESTQEALEQFVGLQCRLAVSHSEGGDGTIYANIDNMKAQKEGAEDLEVDEEAYTRVQDRDGSRTQTGASSTRDDWEKVKVHVGKCEGSEVGELDKEAIEALHTHWLPEAKKKKKPTAADKRLMNALEEAMKVINGTSEDDDEGEEPNY